MKSNAPLKARDLLAIGYKEDRILGLALQLSATFSDVPKSDVVALFLKLRKYPESFLDDETLKGIAQLMIEAATPDPDAPIPLRQSADDYAVYGAEYIEAGARRQMDVAMKLPVTVAGALMPDAHQGYGLPIGGVLATRDAIIPYAVGVDIGCRMALTVFDIPGSHLLENASQYKRELVAHTLFGAGANFKGSNRSEHAVLDNQDFNMTPFIGSMHDKAWSQLGSSGGGNHFVEWGIITFAERDAVLNIDAGAYLALLSHSGSRGFGATIAGHYTRLARELCKLPQEAINLAYLDMNSAEGQEYWLAMNLAGEYASACHDIIHRKLIRAIGGHVLARVENHHNFAWKEQWQGGEVLVHRKGATPAGKGVMGIIPGSMTAPGFLVRGRGLEASINSASHGAGRQMSRTAAVKNISRDAMRADLKAHGVSLIGAGLDEAPMAYKDINRVMDAQQDLVDIVARFKPKIVRMADDGSRED